MIYRVLDCSSGLTKILIILTQNILLKMGCIRDESGISRLTKQDFLIIAFINREFSGKSGAERPNYKS